ncbi:MAG: MBL fold metallo-hydrolase [Pseudomonadota bacterium]
MNIFLIIDEELALIDDGPWREGYADGFSSCLAKLGFSIKDISKIIYTHPHPDHMGGGIALEREAASLHMVHQEAKAHVEPYGEYVKFMKSLCKETFLKHLHRHPAKRERYTAVIEKFWYPPFGEIEIERGLVEGEIIKAGKRKLEVIFNPGHSPWDISLWEAENGLLFSGDAWMQKPTTLISGLGGFGSDLNAYESSLKKSKKYLKRARWVLPSHGAPIRDGSGLAEDLLGMIKRREERIVEKLSAKASSLAALEEMFSPNNDPVVFVRRLGVILSHIEKLEKEERVLRWKKDNGDILFELKK